MVVQTVVDKRWERRGKVEDGDDYGRRLKCGVEAQSFFFVRFCSLSSSDM